MNSPGVSSEGCIHVHLDLQNDQNGGPYTAHIILLFWDIGPLFWAFLEVQAAPL